MKGDEAPEHVHPLYLRDKDGKRTNHSQFLPTESRELFDNEHSYDVLCDTLEEVFKWLAVQVRTLYLTRGLVFSPFSAGTTGICFLRGAGGAGGCARAANATVDCARTSTFQQLCHKL